MSSKLCKCGIFLREHVKDLAKWWCLQDMFFGNGNDLGLCLQATRTRHNTLKVGSQQTMHDSNRFPSTPNLAHELVSVHELVKKHANQELRSKLRIPIELLADLSDEELRQEVAEDTDLAFEQAKKQREAAR
eukprot:4899824-Amphidinium_carterae.2